MQQLTRRTAFVAVALVSLGLASCSSNNKGKIEGTKWETTQTDQKTGRYAHVTVEFGKDKSYTMHIDVPGMHKVIRGKYRLGYGDKVTIYDLDEAIANRKKHTETVLIRGNTLTMKDSDGTTAVFTKMNAAVASGASGK